jgi:hypothetical protein
MKSFDDGLSNFCLDFYYASFEPMNLAEVIAYSTGSSQYIAFLAV